MGCSSRRGLKKGGRDGKQPGGEKSEDKVRRGITGRQRRRARGNSLPCKSGEVKDPKGGYNRPLKHKVEFGAGVNTGGRRGMHSEGGGDTTRFTILVYAPETTVQRNYRSKTPPSPPSPNQTKPNPQAGVRKKVF